METEYRFMRAGVEDKFGLLKLQDKILEIMDYIDKLCSANSKSRNDKGYAACVLLESRK